MLRNVNSYKSLLTMQSGNVDIDKVTGFVLHIIYNRPLREKTPGECRHKMITTIRRGTKRRYPSIKALPPELHLLVTACRTV